MKDRTVVAVNRLAAGWGRAWPALFAYLAVRAVGVAVVVWWGHRRGLGAEHLLAGRYDSLYYVNIAQHGYLSSAAVGCGPKGPLCQYAFFPLYPELSRAVAAVLPLSATTAAWAVAVVASVIAAWGVFAVADRVAGRRAAVLTVVLWGIAPHAIVESMAYTEPLFTACAAWALYAVLGRRWLTAGLLAALAGLTRPSGVAVVAAVALCAGGALLRPRPEEGDHRGRAAAALALAPAGLLAWVAWVAHRAGRWDGYTEIQRRWGSTFDGGAFTAARIGEVFTQRTVTLDMVVGAGTVIAAVVLLVVCGIQRQPVSLLVYSAVLLFIAVAGAGFFHSRARFLLPAFPLLIPVARAMAVARPAVVAVWLAAGVAVSSAYGGYVVLVWWHSP